MKEIENKPTILDLIINVLSKTYDKKIDKAIEDSNIDLKKLAEYFNCEIDEAFFLAILLDASHEHSGSVGFKQIAQLLKCKTIKLYKYNYIFENLVKKKYIIQRANSFDNSVEYILNEKISENIFNKKPFPDLSLSNYTSFIDVLKDIKKLNNNFYNEYLSDLEKAFDDLAENYSKFKIFKKLRLIKMNFSFEYSFYILAWQLILGKQEIEISKVVNVFNISEVDKIKLLQDFVDENKNLLIKNKIIEIKHNEFVTDSLVSILPKGIKLLQEEGLSILSSKNTPKEVLLSKNIKKINLFFDKKEQEQIKMIEDVLSQRKYTKIKRNLKLKNLPIGISAMFHGFPGTGKTESILQIAKKTGRDIFKVDISDTKSKWFGDSEKKIKQVFDDYKEYKKQCKKTPILLFNEADAILSKRKNNNFSEVSQTENAIQNILLEELENFEGIFLATTNLVDNLDDAFERRFLFKIEFSKPSAEVISKIWKSKIKKLSTKQCTQLANSFSFTGGQINNIIRKIEMFEIINDENIGFSKIKSFCEDETFVKQTNRTIGYSVLNTG